MKVGRNDPTVPGIVVERWRNGTAKRTSVGLPLRLEIAARFWSGFMANPSSEWNYSLKDALEEADRLIELHNQSCGGE